MKKKGLLNDKLSMYFESPLYTRIINAYNNINSKNWTNYLDRTLEEPAIHKPLNENIHSLCMYTKVQNDRMDEFRQNIPQEVKDIIEKSCKECPVLQSSSFVDQNKNDAYRFANINPILIKK